MFMDYNKLIEYIEDKRIVINDINYYHAFDYNKQNFSSMIINGIKSPILLNKKGNGHNGKFYVSLSKNENVKYSVNKILIYQPAFIIDNNIKVVKCKNFITDDIKKLSMFSRVSEFDDEYQKFLKVPKKYIVGIRYNLYKILIECSTTEIIKQNLLILKQIINDLRDSTVDLPIIDLSNSTLINQEKVLRLKIK